MWWLAAALFVSSMVREADQPVGTRMRNVVLHLDPGVELQVEDLAGQLVSRMPGRPPTSQIA